MRHIQLTIEYDGTHFNGWQIQSPHHRTVQATIETALQTIFKKKIRCIGSGRTDSGVHAWGQVAHFKTPSRLTTDEITRALNAHLPKDIVIRDVRERPNTFHAQFNAKRKTYRYIILNRDTPSALERNGVWHIPQNLNLRRMRQAARFLMGKKDFRAFMAADPAARRAGKVKNTVRTLYRLDIKRRKDHICIEMEADGFLYKMVRNIVGTLVEIGRGKYPGEYMREILIHKDRHLAGKTAPAQGLFLMQVRY